MMRQRVIVFGTALVLWLLTGTAHAVVLIVRGVEKPVTGYLVRQDAETIVIRDSAKASQGRERTFRKAELDDILITVSPDRLSRLRAAEPNGYRDYAEELAEKRQDPEARDMSLRLFVIAAHLSPRTLGRSALLAMIDLARDPAEATRFRAMAYLLDADHDTSLLKEIEIPVSVQRDVKDRERSTEQSQLLTAIRMLRRGEREAAKRIADRLQAKKEPINVGGILSHDEFVSACQESELSAESLRKLVRAEIAVLDQAARESGATLKLANTTEPKGELKGRWLGELRNGEEPIPTLTLDRVTEFDPRFCEFHEGKWVLPSPQP